MTAVETCSRLVEEFDHYLSTRTDESVDVVMLWIRSLWAETTRETDAAVCAQAGGLVEAILLALDDYPPVAHA